MDIDHSLAIVAILTVGFSLASLFAYIMQKVKLPAILGYLLAGFIIGPYFPGFVADTTIAEQLAEIGIILMLFSVGLHFKIQDLVKVKNIAIPGAVGQTLMATVIALLIVHTLGWRWEQGLIMGLAVGVASTVVLIRVLTEHKLLKTIQGHIAIGWLIVEDIFTVIILLLIPTFAAISLGDSPSMLKILGDISFVILKFALLILLMFTWGHKLISLILISIARARSQELFTLTIIAIVFLVATGSAYIFGTSIALGAFIAGMVIGKTSVRHQAAANALPLKDIFAIIFFLSVGMLFNPKAIIGNFPLFLGVLFVILIIKPIVAYFITITLRYSFKVALTVAISLAQIGEFSFILAEEAMKFKLLPPAAFDILVACALVSISINPLLFQLIGSTDSLFRRLTGYKTHKITSSKFTTDNQPKKVLVIGFGPIGKEVAKILKSMSFTPIIIENNIDTVSSLGGKHAIIFGEASELNILKSLHIDEIDHVLITISDSAKTFEIIHSLREVNPAINILARIQHVIEKPLMEELKVNYVCSESESLKVFTTMTRQLFGR